MLKKLLIIYPHFPPSNLAGVHRPRLFANHLPHFGWEPVVLTVHEKYYEESLDMNLLSLLPKNLRIEKVSAYRITKPRLIGDLGLRAFFQLRKRALHLLTTETFDFILIPIPSFYTALLGNYLYKKTGVKYGIDYIDPWVHNFPGSSIQFSRHWWSEKLSKILEPMALKNAALVTGVDKGYYKPALERNPILKSKILSGAMPYGAEPLDFELSTQLSMSPYLFNQNNKLKLVYAGALLPNAFSPLENIFTAISKDMNSYQDLEIYFIGTGKNTGNQLKHAVKDLAIEYDLWQRVVFEYPKRIPYLDVLTHLKASNGSFILGSTESHYTPSKLYLSILSGKSILAILHQESLAVKTIYDTETGIVLAYNGIDGMNSIRENFNQVYKKWYDFQKNYVYSSFQHNLLTPFTAKQSTRLLVELIEQAIS